MLAVRPRSPRWPRGSRPSPTLPPPPRQSGAAAPTSPKGGGLRLRRLNWKLVNTLETSVATVRPSRCAVLSAALHRPRSLPSGAWQMHRAPWRPPSRLGPAASSPPCYATSAQRWVANAGQADGKTVTSDPGSRPINVATRTPFECARPNHPKRTRSLVSGSPTINYASASGCLRKRQLWHRPHRCESTVPTRRAHYRCCVCWTRLARRLRRARRAILTCHRMHCSLWLQTEREAGLVHLALRPSADPQATI